MTSTMQTTFQAVGSDALARLGFDSARLDRVRKRIREDIQEERYHGVNMIVARHNFASIIASALPLFAWLHGTQGFNVMFGVLSVVAVLIFLATFRLPAREEFSPAPSAA